MRTTTHGDHLIRLERMRFSNCYLVREEDGLTLVDTSFPRSATSILRAAEAIGAPIRRIAITHCHNDHVGSLDALKRELPDAEVALSEREAELMRGEIRRRPEEPDDAKLRGFVFHEQKTRPDTLLDDGDRFGSLQVIAAPGHTPGHLAFLDTRDRTLIAGDAYLAIGKVFVTSEVTLRFPLPATIGLWHARTANRSAQRLRDLEPSRLATGHGRVVESPIAHMDHALAQVGSGS